MPRENVSLQAFNRGEISHLALARTDLTRTRLSAEEQTNFLPSVLGSMMLRPGWQYINSTLLNRQAFHIPFIPSTSEMAIIELTDAQMRVYTDETILTRASVSTAFTNGTFNTDLTGWTDADQTGATSAWVTGGYMGLLGTRYNAAIRQQTLTIAANDQNVRHAVRVVVTRGEVYIRIGSTSGDDDYIASTLLLPGYHSLSFVPTGSSAYVEISSNTSYQSLVDSISIEASGQVILPAIWAEADLTKLRYTQSVDVMFIACQGYRPQRIERRSQTSWSIVDFMANNGPFKSVNTTAITLTPGALSGDTTLTASQKYFKSTNVGSLFKLSSIGQTVTGSLSGAGQYTGYVKVTGTGTARNLEITRAGTWSGTLTVQRATGTPDTWLDTTTTYTTNATVTYNDGLDNQIVYYRVGFNTGNYTSGTATVTLSVSSGSITGICRVTSYTSSTVVQVSVLSAFGSTSATELWYEGYWSPRRGYPTSVALYEGRLWWAGKDRIWGSISDAFDSYDEDIEDDEDTTGPINRSIGEGPVDTINWLLPLSRLIVGAEGAEFSARSSTFDEPLTPNNFNLKSPTTQGSSAVAAVKKDNGGFFVSGNRIFEIVYNSDTYDYSVVDVTTLVPEMCEAMVTRLAIQRKPDTRLHVVLQDGTVALMVYDKAEDVVSWIGIETDGEIEDAFVLPNSPEDLVYYVVKRNINGHAVRYLERWADTSDCVGGEYNKQADSFVLFNSGGAATTVITGLSSLENEKVVAWGDGIYLGTYTVSGGQITVNQAVVKCIVGLTYRARFKSAKLAYAAGGGTALNFKKRVIGVGLILWKTHRFGVKFGGDFDHLDDLPGVEQGADVSDDYVWDQYDEDLITLNGDWNTDSRLCIEANAPKPATILCATISVETNG